MYPRVRTARPTVLVVALGCVLVTAAPAGANECRVGVSVQPVDLLAASPDSVLWSTNGSGRTVEMTAALPPGCIALEVVPGEPWGEYAAPGPMGSAAVRSDSSPALLMRLAPGGGGCHLKLRATTDPAAASSANGEVILTLTLRSPDGAALATVAYSVPVAACTGNE